MSFGSYGYGKSSWLDYNPTYQAWKWATGEKMAAGTPGRPTVAPPEQTEPGPAPVVQTKPQKVHKPPSQKTWMERNWPWLIVGGVVLVGGVAFGATRGHR